MAEYVKCLLVLLCISINFPWFSLGAALSSVLSTQHTNLQNLEYLPPYKITNYGLTTTATFIEQPSQAMSPTYSNFYQTQPQLNGRMPMKTYSSYAPPASGAAPFEYSTPQATNQVPLPALMPKSLVAQLATSTAPLQQQHSYDSGSNSPLLMIEAPGASSILTPSQNRTLEAARILASTLLEASGEATLAAPTTIGSATKPNMNSTDVLIVRAQKNAYIIPVQLSKDVHNLAKTRALYQMRDQLEKAYTINQFIFIIKPERINFLNKLI